MLLDVGGRACASVPGACLPCAISSAAACRGAWQKGCLLDFWEEGGLLGVPALHDCGPGSIGPATQSSPLPSRTRALCAQGQFEASLGGPAHSLLSRFALAMAEQAALGYHVVVVYWLSLVACGCSFFICMHA